MRQKSVHRFIYKIESGVLKKAEWKLKLPIRKAMRNCPDVIVSLNDSQCLRFIDEINGIKDIDESVKSIQSKIRIEKKKPKSRDTKLNINGYYDKLYELQFQKDYICVIMDSEEDYMLVNHGFSVDYGDVDGNQSIIQYRRLLGTNGGIKNSTIVYVNEKIYPELKRRLDNGRNMSKELIPAKLEAYQALICSGSVPLPEPKGIIVVNDCITFFKEDIILIDDSQCGEPILTHEKDYEIEHNDSDGYGFMSPDYSRKVNEYFDGTPGETIAGMNTRYAWNKGMLYTFDFVKFAEKIAGTYEVVDAWGDKRDVRDADIILTVSMLKLWDSYKSWEDYYRNCQENHYQFSTPKTTPKNLENVRDTNYQFLQSYDFTDEELAELCRPTIAEIKDVIGLDYRKSLTFLAGFGLNEGNVFNENTELYIQALMADSRMINDPFIRKKIYSMIKKRIEMGERGAIRINANFAMISGDPYALAQSMFGLPVTGLLRQGEVYHKYWIDKGAKEIACFRAPMTAHNNIRKMKLLSNDDMSFWYQYIDTVLIFNAFDSACEAMNGADKDGDTSMCTDNPIILSKTLNSPTIICPQRKAKKTVVTEDDIIVSNAIAFNDDIGIITNRVTSMIEIQSGFPTDSEEYKELSYRIMCGQLFQQNSIDRAKGIISKPMPKCWFDIRECKIKDEDDDAAIAKKKLNFKIAATKKPYFMTHIYPKLKSENDSYVKNNNRGVARRFSQYGINNIRELELYEPKTEAMIEFLKYYKKREKVGNNGCVVNRISWIFEKEFYKYLQKSNRHNFDYTIMKSGVSYSGNDYNKIYAIYQDYNLRLEELQAEKKSEKVKKNCDNIENDVLMRYFIMQCERICTNEDELCDIVLDICYQTEKSKQFAWDICGEKIVKNLLSRNANKIHYPQLVCENGDFTYCGKEFVMREKEMEVLNNVYFE